LHFSACRPNSLKHSSHKMPVRPHQRIDCCDRCIGRRNNMATMSFLINNTFVTMSKLFTPHMYCWSRRTLVTIHWMHFRLNDICTKFFCRQKMNNRTLFLTRCYQQQHSYLMFISDVIIKQLVLTIKSPTKRLFRNFYILKINRIIPFCDLFLEWPS